MLTRELTEEEFEQLSSCLGAIGMDVTCQNDIGYGPCGTYLDWCDGKCKCGHTIEIIIDDDD